MIFRVFRPEVFQGDLKKTNYFEGWYFKHVSKDLKHVWSFIPGVSLVKNDPHAFIQAIDGVNGNSEYFTYSLSDFSWSRKSLFLKLGNSIFTDKKIIMDARNDKLEVTGTIEYRNLAKFPGKLLSPGIMGWYSFVPFMECKHGIVSATHDLRGTLNISGEEIDFSRGKGYIEKDWGTSFPEVWLWVQANNFNEPLTSFSFSVAKIPWLGRFFMGFISFLYYDGKYHVFATYNKSGLTRVQHSDRQISFNLMNRDNLLEVEIQKYSFGELRAPVQGNMTRRIKESIDSEVRLNLYDRNMKLLYSDTSKRAGLEVVEKIFDYLKPEDND